MVKNVGFLLLFSWITLKHLRHHCYKSELGSVVLSVQDTDNRQNYLPGASAHIYCSKSEAQTSGFTKVTFTTMSLFVAATVDNAWERSLMVNTCSRMFTLTQKHPSTLQKSTIILHLKIVSTNFLDIFYSIAKTKQKECTLYLKYASVMIALVYNENYISLLKLIL